MRHPMVFNRNHKEFEPIYDINLNKQHIEDYKLREANRNYQNSKVVYDCMEISPFYASVNEYIKSED